MTSPTRRENLVETLARTMRPSVFNGIPDDQVKPTIRYERGRVRRYAEMILDSGLVVDSAEVPPLPTENPREAYLTNRQIARSGRVVYDGREFPISFTRDVQARIQALADAWRVPRSEMIRYLTASALDLIEALPIPKEDQQEGSESK